MFSFLQNGAQKQGLRNFNCLSKTDFRTLIKNPLYVRFKRGNLYNLE